jgi:hypothetical protein
MDMYTCKNLTANRAAIASKPGSHNMNRVHPKKMVGCQTAIAGRPAPTI